MQRHAFQFLSVKEADSSQFQKLKMMWISMSVYSCFVPGCVKSADKTIKNPVSSEEIFFIKVV